MLNEEEDMSADAPSNNTPSRPGSWLLCTVQLADGRTLELQLPAAVAGSVSTCDPPPDGNPSLTLVTVDGSRRRGRLQQLLGGRP